MDFFCKLLQEGTALMHRNVQSHSLLEEETDRLCYPFKEAGKNCQEYMAKQYFDRWQQQQILTAEQK